MATVMREFVYSGEMRVLEDSDEEESGQTRFVSGNSEDEPMDVCDGTAEHENEKSLEFLQSEFAVFNERFQANKSFYGDDNDSDASKKVEYTLEGPNESLETTLDFDKCWSPLYQNTVEILKSGKLCEGSIIQYLVVDCGRLVQNHYSLELAQRLTKVMEEYVPLIFKPTIDNGLNAALIDVFYNNWMDFKAKMDLLSYLFIHLNGRVGQRGNRPIWPIGINCLLTLFEDKDFIIAKVADLVIEAINAERKTKQIDLPKVKSLVLMFIHLRRYESIFERKLLAATTEYYKEEAPNRFEQLDLPSYIDYCNARLSEETSRVYRYLNIPTKQKLYRTVHCCVVADLCEQILIKGSLSLFDGSCLKTLKLLYELLRDCSGGHLNLRNAFSKYVKQIGKAKVQDESGDRTLVDDLLTFKERLDCLIRDCFENNEKFVQAEKDAFDFFINTRPNKPAELVAKYMDSKMKDAHKSTDIEFEHLMDKVIVLFRFIEGKDVFEAFYKRDLSKRLLMGRSASVDAEKAMLARLRSECGSGFTSKLEGMFRDMEVSKDTMASFKAHIEKTEIGKGWIEFSVNVLTMGCWPTYDPVDLVAPIQLQEYQTTFKEYYENKNKGRNLSWQYNLATAIVCANFKAGKKELDVSMFQAVVLLLFNEHDSLTFEQILKMTGISAAELVPTLLSLVSSKTPIIKRTKHEKAKILPDELFSFNDDFSHRTYKVKINQVQMKETEREHQQTEEQIQQDRLYVIDANIVRIMKQHKKLNHNLLLTDIFHALKFPARSQDIKKRIESLIEREYMARDPDDPQIYTYVT